MCFFICIGADHSLATVAGATGDIGSFRIEALGPDEEMARTVLATQHVVRACAPPHGCGCGFSYEPQSDLQEVLDAIPDGPERTSMIMHDRARQQAVRDLREYISRSSERGPVHVLACWNDIGPPQQERTVAPSHFGGDGFGFEDNCLYHVIGEPAADA